MRDVAKNVEGGRVVGVRVHAVDGASHTGEGNSVTAAPAAAAVGAGRSMPFTPLIRNQRPFELAPQTGPAGRPWSSSGIRCPTLAGSPGRFVDHTDMSPIIAPRW